MSNSQSNPSFYEGFFPGLMMSKGNGATVHNVLVDLPGGREAMTTVTVGTEQPEALRVVEREEFLRKVYPSHLTEGLEKEIKQLTEKFNDFTGYDRNGKPIMRYTGREREVLEMKLANRRNALVQANRDRAEAERFQATQRAAEAAQEARIEEAARAKAQELIEQAEIDRRAKQIAARAGVK